MATKDDLYGLILDDVRLAMDQLDHSMRMTELRDAGGIAFAVAYEDEGGDPNTYQRAEMEFMNTLNAAATHTIPDGSMEQVERVALMLATAAANAAIVAAAAPGSEFEWVTKLDDRVRDLHRPLHGEVRAAGTPFLVGGIPLQYPGQPVGPPEGWINCRCTLHAALTAAGENPFADKDAEATEDDCPEGQHRDEETGECVPDELAMEPGETADALSARAFDAKKRKAMAKRNTAMPDGSYPIANAEDLRNAIQAIGRAKNPDAVKAHIRRRARALGLTSLIPDSWSASAAAITINMSAASTVATSNSFVAWAPSTSPPGTHDAPGWITHPRATQRLRTYWTKGEGAAKIRWGQPGDFDRCRKQLRKYVVNPEHLAGTCANLHYVALGFWPNQGPHAGKRGGNRGVSAGVPVNVPEYGIDIESEEFIAVTTAFAAAAQLNEELPPIEWFQPPPLTAATPLTITDDDEFVAHLATWDTCHVGISGSCTTAPHSSHDYAYFRTGEMITAGGPVPVGQITMDTGHAGTDLGPGETVRHYDDTGTVVADVSAGEDEHGIWVHGMLRPGLTNEQRRALRAGSLSGDWRRIGGNLELVAALVVNVPGFPIPRTEMAASAAGAPISLVAAAVVTSDPNAIDADRVAIAVIARLDERERRAVNNARVAALRSQINAPRVEKLLAAVGMPS